ncbi:hypothetical protein [Bradyrhizobium sp.]|uniref:hypothetical protein n=1 Tax=Bradyrhizobium sp. TaxID=376 RepID=UPI003C6F6911
MTGSGWSASLNPEQLAEACRVQAKRIRTAPERLRVLTFADALINLAEIKKLLRDYERRRIIN